MSVLGKKPYIQSILESLNKTQLNTLVTLINGSDQQTPGVVSLYGYDNVISDANKGVSYVVFKLDQVQNVNALGYLCYKDASHCAMFSFQNDFNEILVYKIDPVNKNYIPVHENLTADEFRSVLDDILEEGSEFDPTKPVEFEDKVIIQSADDLVDPDGNPLISDTHTVTIDSETISLAEFISNCENGVYGNSKLGTIATMHNLIDGKDLRIILIGVNHDVISATDEGGPEPEGTKTKTTWQFYDMPVKKCWLGLPFISEDPMEGSEGAPGFGNLSPCNWVGPRGACGLNDMLQTVFSSLPILLQEHIKTVRKDNYTPVQYCNDYESYNSTITMLVYENGERYDSSDHKLFCLSAHEVGYSGENFTTTCEDDNENVYNVEGYKYEYFDIGNSESANAKRIRYYDNAAYYYWLRSPYLVDSSCWGGVSDDGNIYDSSTDYSGGLAPAFCI